MLTPNMLRHWDLGSKGRDPMNYSVTDDDILTFLRVNRSKYASSFDLMQAAIQLLWPTGAPSNAGNRVAQLCLQEVHVPRRTRVN